MKVSNSKSWGICLYLAELFLKMGSWLIHLPVFYLWSLLKYQIIKLLKYMSLRVFLRDHEPSLYFLLHSFCKLYGYYILLIFLSGQCPLYYEYINHILKTVLIVFYMYLLCISVFGFSYQTVFSTCGFL